MRSDGSALQAFVTFDQAHLVPLAESAGGSFERRQEREGTGGEAALGNNADFASAIHSTLPPPSTVRNWQLRSYGRQILKESGFVITRTKKTPDGDLVTHTSPRIRWCGSRIARGFNGVGVYARPDRPYGRLGGVCVCGQSLACPVCAPRIAAFRAAEVGEAFKRATARGLEARLVTFTMPHSAATTLGQEIETFSTAWRGFQLGRNAAKRNAYSLGHHTGREVTFGQNGWHYHHHQLRYDEPGKFCADTTHAQWLAALDSVGRKWKGAELHAFDSGVVGTESGARYCAKLATSVEAAARSVGSEIASAATKGRNLATLLQAAHRGDIEARAAWLAGVADITSRKVSSVRWSRGLRSELGLAIEKTDEQVAQEEILETDVFLGALNPLQWRGVQAHAAEFALLCAAQKGEDAVNDFLTGLGLGNLNDELPLRFDETKSGA